MPVAVSRRAVAAVAWADLAVLAAGAVSWLVLSALEEERRDSERFLLDRVVRSCGEVVDRSVPPVDVEQVVDRTRRRTTTATRRDGGRARVVYELTPNSLGHLLVEVECDVGDPVR